MNDEDSNWISFEDAVTYVEATLQCHRERAAELVRQAANNLRLKSRTVNSSPRWIVSDAAIGEAYYSDHGIRIELYREDVLALCKSKSASPKIRSGANSDGIHLAINDLWPDGIPAGVRAKERNNHILGWLKRNNKSIPTDIARAVQRVLKARDAS